MTLYKGISTNISTNKNRRIYYKRNGSINRVNIEIIKTVYRNRELFDLDKKSNLLSIFNKVIDITDLGNYLFKLKV